MSFNKPCKILTERERRTRRRVSRRGEIDEKRGSFLPSGAMSKLGRGRGERENSGESRFSSTSFLPAAAAPLSAVPSCTFQGFRRGAEIKVRRIYSAENGSLGGTGARDLCINVSQHVGRYRGREREMKSDERRREKYKQAGWLDTKPRGNEFPSLLRGFDLPSR